MANTLRLAMMTFPQTWNGAGTLVLNVLLVPSVDPVAGPLIGSNAATPSFADGTPKLSVVVIPGLTGLPKSNAPNAIPLVPTITSPPPSPAATFAQLKSLAQAQSVTIAPPSTVPAAVARVRKALPSSYLAVGGGGPNGNTTTSEDDFSCAVRAVPPVDTKPAGPKRLSWGEVISYALRRRLLATALGLRYELSISLGTAHGDAFAQGGWVYVTLAAADPWQTAAAANPGALLVHAARLPALAETPRSVFAAVQFLIDGGGGSPMDDSLLAAEVYSDGFAKLVHCTQPDTADPALGGTVAPGNDLGLEIGWDDEQVTKWHNDQLSLLAASRGGTLSSAPQAALGVLGYRVDVADVTPIGPHQKAPLQPAWQSLVAVTGMSPGLGGAFSEELSIEPVPAKPASPAATDAWLPKYFAIWRGGSLCEPDPIPRALAKRTEPAAPLRTASGLTTLLSYGRTYAFRVRLADLSCGGPEAKASPVDPFPTATATQTFRRLVPPKSPAIATSGGTAPEHITVSYPVIGYPEVLYTGLGETEVARDALRGQLVKLAQNKTVPVAGVPDPDVDCISITVEVAHPLHDVGSNAGSDSHPRVYQTLYTTSRQLAALKGSAPIYHDPGTKIRLAYVAAPSILVWPSTMPDSGPLLVPRGRNVRLTFRGVTRSTDPTYFAPQALQGHPTQIVVRAEADGETALLVADPAKPTIRGLLFRRPPNVAAPSLVAQLAQELDVVADGDTLAPPPGRRIVFGASRALRHMLSADGETLKFGATNQLLNYWIVAIVVDLARDWTWDGLTQQGVIVLRREADSLIKFTAIGNLTIPAVLGPAATTKPSIEARSSTRLIFLDAVDPHEQTAEGFPVANSLQWRLMPRLRPVPATPPLPSPTPPGTPAPPPGGTELASTVLDLTLPIAIPPTQVPAIASVGIAMSPYQIGKHYASTAPRTRALWIELKEPIANSRGDALFARVLAHGADPLLYRAVPRTPADANPPLPLDPELVRVVFPHDTDDRAGESAMIGLLPSPVSDRHFLLPLPPGVKAEDPELFGFYSYELRVGHSGPAGDLKWWSTANGRFGLPLRVVGVQHPAPPLSCHAARIGTNADQMQKLHEIMQSSNSPFRHSLVNSELTPVSGSSAGETSPNMLVASGSYATPVLNGRPLVKIDEPPRTSLWFFLYAQAVQMDGASMRNILLAIAPGVCLRAVRKQLDQEVALFFRGYFENPGRQRDRIGVAVFAQSEIDQILADWHLPASAPLSILAVEMLPGGTIPEPSRAATYVKDEIVAEATNITGASAFHFGRILRASPLSPIAPYC